MKIKEFPENESAVHHFITEDECEMFTQILWFSQMCLLGKSWPSVCALVNPGSKYGSKIEGTNKQANKLHLE